MKKIISPALVVLLLLFLPTMERSVAQEAQIKTSPLPWALIGDGVQVLRLWEIDGGPKWPQIAILRLPVKEYKEFLEHPVDYLNDHKVYPPKYPAKKVILCRTNHPEPPNSECLVSLFHTPNSTSSASASCKVTF